MGDNELRAATGKLNIVPGRKTSINTTVFNDALLDHLVKFEGLDNFLSK
jgi:hypothetical protein